MVNIEYYLCYNTPLGRINGVLYRRIGKQKIDGNRDKPSMLSVARELCKIYGEHTHWIEDETGERLEASS